MRIPGRAVLDAEDYVFLGTVLLLPWAFGGVELWAYRTAGLGCVTAAAIAYFKRGRQGLGLDRRAAWLWPAALLAVWALIQIAPLPPSLVRVVSPAADAIYTEAFPGYRGPLQGEMHEAIEQQGLSRITETRGLSTPAERDFPFERRVGGRWTGWRSLSLHPSMGRERLHWYLALLLVFLLVRRRARDPKVARVYRNALFGMFVMLALFGLIYAASGNGKLYWIRPTLYTTHPIGPYVNPTNFAGMMELAVPWLGGAAMLLWRRSRGQPLRKLRAPVFGAGALLCLLAGFASGSKSAALLLSAGIMLVALAGARGPRARWTVLGAILTLGATVWVGLQHLRLGERVRQFIEITGGSFEEVGRWVAWKSTIPMLGDYWICGTGFGAFRDVYPGYMPAGETARWAQLHNDYLQVLIEGGVIAAVLLLWLLAGFLRRLFRRATLRARDGLDLESVGMVVSLGLLFVHAGFDFNHQIPANALTFVVLAALLIARGDRRAFASRVPR